MLLPTSHLSTLIIVILSMLCLGLWANTFKRAGTLRFELYYFDFAIGVFITAVIAAFTVGTLGFDGFSFADDLLHASKKQDLQGFLAGMVFNLGNMLLVAAISVAGMAIAFPIAVGIALIIGVFVSFAFRPEGNAGLLFSGAAVVLVAIVVAAFAYRNLKLGQIDELLKAGKLKSTRKKVSLAGVYLAIASGIFLGAFLPLLDKSQAGESGLGAYGVGFVFAAGILVSTFLFNLFFMNLPVAGPPIEFTDYFKSSVGQHFLALLGGALWYCGMLMSLVGAHAEGPAALSPSTVYGTAEASAVLAALCGILLWKEFKGSDMKAKAMIFVMFALFICGLGMITVAPMWSRG
jgi:glucose uptake protein